jgi:hypothetical protein
LHLWSVWFSFASSSAAKKRQEGRIICFFAVFVASFVVYRFTLCTWDASSTLTMTSFLPRIMPSWPVFMMGGSNNHLQ